MSGRLEGRTVLLAGGAGAVGEAIARRLGEEGAWVSCWGWDEAAAELAAKLPAGGEAIEVDVCAEDRVAAAAAALAAQRGRIDVLVNGGAGAVPYAAAEAVGSEQWELALRRNLTAAFVICKRTRPHLAEAGGCVVNVASALGIIGSPGAVALGAAQAGLIQMTRTLALEWAPEVRVNALCPGVVAAAVDSASAAADGRSVADEWGPLHPLGGRCAEPGEVADAALFLASDDASFMTGASLAVDGGLVAS